MTHCHTCGQHLAQFLEWQCSPYFCSTGTTRYWYLSNRTNHSQNYKVLHKDLPNNWDVKNHDSRWEKNLDLSTEEGFHAKTPLIHTAYIISPSRGKGFSSSNCSDLYLRSSTMMHCGLRFKYHDFSHLVVSSTDFGKSRKNFRPSVPPSLVALDAVSYPCHTFCPDSRGYPVITCMQWEWFTNYFSCKLNVPMQSQKRPWPKHYSFIMFHTYRS